MPTYNKLVRDRIPEIIAASGKKYTTRILSDPDYREKLNQKLQEELDEYLKDRDIAELADLLEVVYAAAQAQGVSKEELEQIRLAKANERGGFDQKLLLVEVEG
jgi:predicted house-cleaning noncanonical NTP pyrophosphatase (MazG superfamily)